MAVFTLNRYFSRELALTFVAVSAVLLTVVISKSFISLLTRVMDGKMSADAVLSILGLGILDATILLAPFALFVSVMLVLGRLYRDSEIYAIKANGISVLRLFRYAVLFVLPVLVLLAYASLFLTPQIAQKIETIKLEAKERTSIMGLVPGQFIEARQGDWVVFIEAAERKTGTARNIFIYDQRGERVSIETAHSAQQAESPEVEGKSLVLTQGQRYEGIPGEGGFTVLSFDRHIVRIPELDVALDRDDPEFMTVAQLLGSHRTQDQAELQWRLSIPLAALLLILLAFPLSVVRPRQGRFAKLVLAIVIYLIYSNLMILAETWVANGRLPTVPGLFIVHGALVIMIAVYFYRQGAWRYRA
ncbi:MAG: LPS export ABC transporter permease LptF [Gammaproteobacteria bacterium]|nr:LPS export ABC transporter permease LptF [Gammaproteobacteria bacterium]